MESTTNAQGMLFNLTGEQVPRLTISGLNGDIEVEGWERPAIQITSDDESEDESLQDMLQVAQQGNDVTIQPFPAGRDWRMDKMRNMDEIGRSLIEIAKMVRRATGGLALDLKIRVPYNCDLNVQTVTGDIQIRRIQGKLYVQTISGDVELHEIRGNVLAKSTSGDVEISELQGRLGMSSMSGELKVKASELAGLSAGTASGDISIGAVLHQSADYEFHSVSGDVDLALPGDTQALVDVETVSGDAECDLPHQVERRSRRHRVLQLNGGGATRIRVRTTSGDLNIRRGPGSQPAGNAGDTATDESPAETRRFSPEEVSAAAATQANGEEHFRAAGEAPADAADPAGQTQRLAGAAGARSEGRKSPEMTILEAIESGDLSVDEGLRRLSELAR